MAIEVPLTQNELASMVAATRESVNKALATFKADDLVKLSGNSLVVVDPRRLEAILGQRGR